MDYFVQNTEVKNIQEIWKSKHPGSIYNDPFKQICTYKTVKIVIYLKEWISHH